MLPFLGLLLLVSACHAGTAPASMNTTKLSVLCPSDPTTFNTSWVQVNYTVEAGEDVQAMYVYAPSSCMNYSFTEVPAVSGSWYGSIYGSCFQGDGINQFASISLQYGTVARISDHLYGILCQYMPSQTVSSSAMIANPVQFNNSANVTGTARTGAAVNENINITFIDTNSQAVTQMYLGDQVAIKVDLGTSAYTGFFIESIIAYNSLRDISYTLLDQQCQAVQAQGDTIDASIMTANYLATSKQTQYFPAFRFQMEQTVVFDVTVSFCLTGTMCTTPPTCGGGSGRRRREVVRVARQTTQQGGLTSDLYVLARGEDGRSVFVPVSVGTDLQQTYVTDSGPESHQSLQLYLVLGGVALLVVLMLAVVLAVFLRRRSQAKRPQ